MLRLGRPIQFARGLASAATATAPAPAAAKRPARVGPNIVLVEAVRTPFVMSGTVFKDLWAVDLQREALKGTKIQFLFVLFVINTALFVIDTPLISFVDKRTLKLKLTYQQVQLGSLILNCRYCCLSRSIFSGKF
ncbi:unnamed protein product [Strongylus vulgaris]|uniref:Uncharacterized protein n=1 Tax=Strongylus vulgaris TaxID=40348 RepID=A0A3P7IB50_STRVU|nr:unnamed protein product [Strongylus vulgaris]